MTFIVHEGNFGSEYTKPLKIALEAQLRTTRIDGHAWVLTGAEYNEEDILRYWARRSRAIVLVLPAGGTTYYGGLIQVLYDVRVLEIRAPNDAKTVWRARTSAGAGVSESWFETLAAEVVDRLVADGVLPRRERKS